MDVTATVPTGGPVLLENENVFELPAVEGAANGSLIWSVIDPAQQMVFLL